MHYAKVCSWKPALARRNGRKGVPVWPRGTPARRQLAQFRHVVGGFDKDLCAREKGMLYIAATDRAWVFVNGRHVIDVHSATRPQEVEIRIREGDVISVKAMDVEIGPHAYGIAVDLLYRGRHVVTTAGSGPWRVIGMYKTPDPADQFAFMRGRFDDCQWEYGARPRHMPQFRNQKDPFRHGAQYVWGGNAQNPASIVFARMVVGGGERCEVDGQSESGTPTTCPCKLEETGGGNCWYFTNGSQWQCDRRDCEKRYVCHGGAEAMKPGAMICMKKIIPERIVPKKDSNGFEKNGYCHLVPDKHAIWVLYDRRRD